jgi:hypothetical protein
MYGESESDALAVAAESFSLADPSFDDAATEESPGLLVVGRALVSETLQGELRGLTHDAALVFARRLEGLEALLARDGAEGLRRLVAHHPVLALVAQGRLEGRDRSRRAHLAERERHLVLEQGARVLAQTLQQSGDGRVAPDASKAEERAEATRQRQRLVEELAAERRDAHRERGGGRRRVGRKTSAGEASAPARSGRRSSAGDAKSGEAGRPRDRGWRAARRRRRCRGSRSEWHELRRRRSRKLHKD